MRLEIDVGFNKAFNWKKSGNVYYCGYISDDTLSFESISQCMAQLDSVDKIKEYVCRIRGNFAFIIEMEQQVVAFVDIVRSIPLYYSKEKDVLVITDNPKGECIEISKNPYLDEYSAAGFVSGKNTLLNNVYQIEAGCCIISNINTGIIDEERYYDFRHKESRNYEKSKLIDEYFEICKDSFGRMIASANNRQLVVPLSGGSDSRLVVTMLKMLGYTNVVCFTYGKKNSSEYNVAKLVAEKLDYRWYFIEYTKSGWNELYDSNEFVDILKYASGNSSIVCIQPIIAVKYLKDKGLIEKDAIFVPGHTGDFIVGGHIPYDIISSKSISSKKLIELIFEKHYGLNKNVNAKVIKNTIRDRIVYKDKYTNVEAADEYENFDWRERQAKFISNDVRIYEFYGYEWRLPLWDVNTVRYWEKIATEDRFERRLYFTFENKFINSQYGISHNSVKKSMLSKIKRSIRKMVKKMPFAENFFIGYSVKNSYLTHPCDFYSFMQDELKANIRRYGATFNINTVMINKYIDYLEKR